MGRYVWSLLIFGASPERNREYYLNQMAQFVLDLTVRVIPQSMFNPTRLSNVYFGLDTFNILKNTLIFHNLYANTSAFDHLFEPHVLDAPCLQCLKIFAYPFPLPGPSHFPILAWSLAILDCVLHEYFIWVNIPLLSEFLWACPEFSWRSEYERA